VRRDGTRRYNSDNRIILGTTGTPSAPVFFDDVLVEAHDTNACFRQPLPCWPNNAGFNTLPDQATVILTGNACGALNTTYVLDRQSDCVNEAYELTGLSLVCGANTIARAVISLTSDGSGNCVPAFILYRSTGTQHGVWSATIGDGSADWCDNTITLAGGGGSAAATI
jgi:hypothetical protein